MDDKDRGLVPHQPTEIVPADTSPESRPSNSDLVELDYRRRRMGIHPLSTAEVRNLATGGNPLNALFFGAAFSLAVGAFFVLVTIPLDPIPHATVVGIFIPSLVLSFYFGAKAWIDWQAVQAKIKEIVGNGPDR